MGAYAVALALSALGVACESIDREADRGTARSGLSGDIVAVLGPELPLPSTAMAALPGHAQNPSVASDGSNYFVVWQDLNDIQGARIDASGARVEPEPFMVWQGHSNAGALRVAFGAGRYLVVFAGTDALRGVFVSANDGVVDSGDRVLPPIACSPRKTRSC